MGKINKYRVLLMGLATIIGFPFLAWALVYFFIDEAAIDYLINFEKYKWTHLLVGLTWGGVFGIIGLVLINLPFMKKPTMKYEQLIESLDLNVPLIIFLSISAGVGEELFFRGAVQPLLGIWVTSILFVAIHGYLNPMDWRIFIYGLILTGFIYSLGYLYEKQSFITASAAHSMYDFVLLLWYLNKVKKKRLPQFDEDLLNL